MTSLVTVQSTLPHSQIVTSLVTVKSTSEIGSLPFQIRDRLVDFKPNPTPLQTYTTERGAVEEGTIGTGRVITVVFHEEGYEGGHDAGGHPQQEGAAEHGQEHAEGLEHGQRLEAVAVVPGGLVGHDGAAGGTAAGREEKRETQTEQRKQTETCTNKHTDRHTHTHTHTHTEKAMRKGWKKRAGNLNGNATKQEK